MKRSLIFFALLALPTLVPAAVPTFDDWDSGSLEGWEPNTTWTTVSVSGSGGNPDGFLLSESTQSALGALSREPRYTGDFVAPNIGRVSLDLSLQSGSVNAVYLRFRYLDGQNNGWRYLITDSLSGSTWQDYTVSFDPTWSDAEAQTAGWIQETTSPSFQETMQNVYTTEVRVLTQDFANTEVGIDNFRLGERESPSAIPALSVWGFALMVLALGYVGLRAPGHARRKL